MEPGAPPTEDESPPPRARLIGWRAVGMVAFLVVLELALKHGGGYGWWTVTERVERYGWQMLPDQDARSRDLTVVEHINGLGFRDRDWDPPRPDGEGGWARDDGVFRVAVLGNSVTYGTSVPIEQVYSRVLEDLLVEHFAEAGDPRTPVVMNFAVQGYCLEQSLRVYEDRVRPFRPDLLVLPLHTQDVQPMKPSADDADYFLRRPLMRTATYDFLLRHVIDRWMPTLPRPKEAREEEKRWFAIEKSLKQRPFAKENRPFFDAAAERLDGLLPVLAEDDTGLVLVVLPRWRKHFDSKVMLADSYFTNWAWRQEPRVPMAQPWPEFERLQKPVVEEIAAKGMAGGSTFNMETVTWVDADGVEHPGTELDTAEQTLHLLNDMGHYSARGHAVIARSILETIVEQGLTDP